MSSPPEDITFARKMRDDVAFRRGVEHVIQLVRDQDPTLSQAEATAAVRGLLGSRVWVQRTVGGTVTALRPDRES